jgi:hypothetical protein
VENASVTHLISKLEEFSKTPLSTLDFSLDVAIGVVGALMVDPVAFRNADDPPN